MYCFCRPLVDVRMTVRLPSKVAMAMATPDLPAPVGRLRALKRWVELTPWVMAENWPGRHMENFGGKPRSEGARVKDCGGLGMGMGVVIRFNSFLYPASGFRVV